VTICRPTCPCYTFFVNKDVIKDVDELRQWIVEEWEQLSQHVIDNAIRQWRRRLRGCVDADGGQFEHSLWLTFWLPQWTSLSFLKRLTILYRLHCNFFSIVFATADQIVHCKEYLLYIPQSLLSVESACILWRTYAANFMQIGLSLYEL